MKFKTTIKFLLFSIISILNLNLLYAQDFGRLAISNFTFKKGNQAAEIIYSTKIIALVSMKGGKIICQINEEKIGQYSYVKYDEKEQQIVRISAEISILESLNQMSSNGTLNSELSIPFPILLTAYLKPCVSSSDSEIL